MNAALLATVAEGAEHAAHTELPMEPIAFGLITFAIFMTMAFVTWSWKGISNRH